MKQQYTAVNIGPIVSTFEMVRRPRQIWAASYLFSHLMKCIINRINETNTITAFSPIISTENKKIGVGLYPDRVYCKGSWNFKKERIEILKAFAQSLDIDVNDNFIDYFNIMCVTVNIDEEEVVDCNVNVISKSETKAIREMNLLLDCLELSERTIPGESYDAIWNYITDEKKKSRLYSLAFSKGKVGITDELLKEDPTITGYGTLAEYASVHLKSIDKIKWEQSQKNALKLDELQKKYPEAFIQAREDLFYSSLMNSFPSEIKTYHKYICVIQADGDNMGKTFSHKELPNNKNAEISEKLITFDINASKTIFDYGGFPIYAGGDDLLFLAPVVGKTKAIDGSPMNIFDLLQSIDDLFKPVSDLVQGYKLLDDNNNPICPSISYGVSISYYKFPLYEALKSASHLLFDVAKKVDGKDAIAWCLHKHAGSSFSGQFSKTALLDSFMNVIKCSNVKESITTAISHKIRENQSLLQLWLGSDSYKQRNLYFFNKYLDYDGNNAYKKSIYSLVNKLYDEYQSSFEANQRSIDDSTDIKILQTDQALGIYTIEQKKEQMKQSLRDDVFKKIYSMIRTAKFINGEEVKDE